MQVANLFPTLPPQDYRLAIVGEAPGESEVQAGLPFVGLSGRVLDDTLSRLGLMRNRCFLGNVCQVRPPGNDITKFKSDGPEIRDGLAQLRLDLAKFAPHLVLCLGRTALWAAKGTYNISDWRGSVFASDTLLATQEFLAPIVKCLATYHPAACLRMYDLMPMFNLDMRRAYKEAFYPELRLPVRALQVHDFFETRQRLLGILDTKPRISLDIEGGVNALSCLGIALSPSDAFVVPFERLDGSSYWSFDEEQELWRLVAAILADPFILKCWQNGLYDRFALQHGYQCIVRGNANDTMLKWWEAYCELEKALAVQASILTDEPFYKFERKAQDQLTFYAYCAKDSAVTCEINDKLTGLLDPAQKGHYEFNNNLLNPLLYMELRGIRYDQEQADTRRADMLQHVWGWQEKLDNEARRLDALDGLDFEAPLLPQVQAICCYKKDPTRPKKEFQEDYLSAVALCSQPTLSHNERGQLSTICGLTMNTKSKFFKDFLYKTCGLPTQWKKDPKTKELKVTTDYEALLKLSKQHDHAALLCSLELSRLRTRCQMLAVRSYMGRMHTSYNLVGSETGRVTSSKSMLWSNGKRVGLNMQTVSDDWDLEDDNHPLAEGLRNLYKADEGCYLGKCDLKGADGWTVGAYMASLNDRTMLDDLLYGIKPAQVVAYILKYGANEIQKYSQDRKTLKEMVSCIKKDDWEYFVSKQGIWGTCLTSEHEVLTRHGWTPINRVDCTQEIAIWDNLSGAVSFAQPTAKIEKLYTGTLFEFEGNSFSQRVTAEHRMPYETNSNLKCTTAETIYHMQSGSLPTSGWYEAPCYGLAVDPELTAAIMSDGCYTKKGNRLTFCFRKERKIERIRFLLDSNEIVYKETTSVDKRDGKKQTYFRCYGAPVIPKRAGAWMLNWSAHQLSRFIGEYPFWDGHKGANNCQTIYSVHKAHLDWIATFCRLTNRGYVYQGDYVSGKGSTVHRLSINARCKAAIKSLNKATVEVASTPVYCFSVPTGYFLVRRNDKISVTGNCYTMGPRKLAERVFIESDGKVNLSESEAKTFQASIYVRYRVKSWHAWMQRHLDSQRYPAKLVAPNGFSRKFFGRKTEILGEALAHMPQVITTYATLKAAHKLWNDPDNRLVVSEEACRLRVEPLHQVHDELVVQFKIEDTEWALTKLKEWFNNTICVAGINLVIPFDGAYGTSWAMDEATKVGDIK